MECSKCGTVLFTLSDYVYEECEACFAKAVNATFKYQRILFMGALISPDMMFPEPQYT